MATIRILLFLCGVLFSALVQAKSYTVDVVRIDAVLLTVIMLVLSAAITRRNIDGERVYQQWRAYSRGIKGINAKRSDAKQVGLHIIYAVALNQSSKRIVALVDALNINPDDLSWFVFMNFHPAGFGFIGNTIGAVTTSLTASVTVAGAGASAGAAGGGAGGGAS
jgi:uncharacterized membrane protein